MNQSQTREEFLSGYAPTAQAILKAARKVLIRGGFDALRFEKIAQESGEGKATIRYHFGDKAGLVAAVVALLSHDATVALLARTEALPEGPARVKEHVETTRHLTTDPAYLSFFDVFPHALREYDELKEPMARLFDWYREMNMLCFGVPKETNEVTLTALASLFIAAADGLAIQQALDPGFDPGPAFELLRETVQSVLGRVSADTTSGEESPARGRELIRSGGPK